MSRYINISLWVLGNVASSTVPYWKSSSFERSRILNYHQRTPQGEGSSSIYDSAKSRGPRNKVQKSYLWGLHERGRGALSRPALTGGYINHSGRGGDPHAWGWLFPPPHLSFCLAFPSLLLPQAKQHLKEALWWASSPFTLHCPLVLFLCAPLCALAC